MAPSTPRERSDRARPTPAVRLDDLTPPQRRLVLALIEAERAAKATAGAAAANP